MIALEGGAHGVTSQLRQPRLRAHAAGREADRRPGARPRHRRGRGRREGDARPSRRSSGWSSRTRSPSWSPTCAGPPPPTSTGPRCRWTAAGPRGDRALRARAPAVRLTAFDHVWQAGRVLPEAPTPRKVDTPAIRGSRVARLSVGLVPADDVENDVVVPGIEMVPVVGSSPWCGGAARCCRVRSAHCRSR